MWAYYERYRGIHYLSIVLHNGTILNRSDKKQRRDEMTCTTDALQVKINCRIRKLDKISNHRTFLKTANHQEIFKKSLIANETGKGKFGNFTKHATNESTIPELMQCNDVQTQHVCECLRLYQFMCLKYWHNTFHTILFIKEAIALDHIL